MNEDVILAPAISHFWQWFVVNQNQLARLPVTREELYPQVIQAIQEVNEGLVCDFEIGDGGGNKKVVISADGKKALFPLVMKVAGEAPLPQLPGWEVVAFRQPRRSHFNLQFADFTLSSDQVMVSYHMNQRDKLDVTIYIENWDEATPEAEAAGLILLDNAIGEYDTEMHIGSVTVKPWPQVLD